MKKIMTFEEEKRQEKIKSVYTTLFIVAGFVFVLRLLFYYPIQSLNASTLPSAVKTLVELAANSVALFVPFFIYGKLRGIGIKNFFEKGEKKIKPTVAALLFLGGLAAALCYPLERLFSFMVSDGFIFSEPYPAATDDVFSKAVFLIVLPLVSAAVTEFSLRTVALGSVKDASHAFSVAAVVILNILLFPEWSSLIMTVSSAIILSALFIKTNSSPAVFAVSFVFRFVSAAAKVFSFEKAGIAVSVIGGTVALVGLILFIAAKGFSFGEKPENAFSKKEGFSALFKNSIIIMLIFVSAVQTFYFYVKKPEKDENKKTEMRYTVETQKEFSCSFSEKNV